MFWKKLASRADETPTSEPGFAGRGLGRQKKSLKTEGFSMFFLAGQNSCDHLGPPAAPKKSKYQVFLSKTSSYEQKNKKTRYFLILFGIRRCKATSLIIITPWLRFVSFPVLLGRTSGSRDDTDDTMDDTAMDDTIGAPA